MELEIRTATKNERLYMYRNSQQISMQTGHIGYLRANMDSDGKGFFSTWNDFRKDMKTDEFKAEFDEVINTCRFNDKYGKPLGSRDLMKQYCNAHKDAEFDGNYTEEYGFRVDTEKYSYLMRLIPVKGDYNLYCYCYKKDWFDNHLRNAEKGIRFITSNYYILFRISDGDKITETDKNGKSIDFVCRYVDDYHVEIGHNLYHICQYAELCEQNGYTVAPYC